MGDTMDWLTIPLMKYEDSSKYILRNMLRQKKDK